MFTMSLISWESRPTLILILSNECYYELQSKRKLIVATGCGSDRTILGAEYQNFLAINIIQEHLLSYLADSRISSQSTIGMLAYPGTLGNDDLYHFSLCLCPAFPLTP